MVRMRLLATVAAAPMLMFAGSALAETTISNNRTTPVSTATANNGAADDVKITNGGKIELNTAGPAVTVNSSNDLTNEGSIVIKDVDNSVGILVTGGVTSDVSNSGTIILDDDYAPKDDDKDGIEDGPFAEGTGKFGIRVIGPGAMTGDLSNSGSIQVSGNDSFGISVETSLIGDFTNTGSVTMAGDDSTGIRLSGDITGDVTIQGSTTVLGENSVGVDVSGDVDGAFVVQGNVLSRGYRFNFRPPRAEDRAKLDDSDKLQGGGGIRISGNVTGGILFDIPPDDLSTTDKDEDDDGIEDAAEPAAAVSVFGEAPAVQIGSATQNLVIGNVGTGDEAYGLIMRGSVTSDGLLDNVTSTGIQIGGGAFDVDMSGGISIEGAITSRSYGRDTTVVGRTDSLGLWLRDGVTAPTLSIDGAIVSIATTLSDNLVDEIPASAAAIQIDAGASVNSIIVGGVVSATGGGERVTTIAIRDLSGSVDYVQVTGSIVSTVSTNDDDDDTDDDDLDPTNEQSANVAIALDLRANTTGVTVRQFGIDDGDDGDDDLDDGDADDDGVDDADEPAILGAVLFGSGADVLDLENGILQGTMSFGNGADTLSLTGGAAAQGALLDSDGQLVVDVANGSLTIENAEVINATSLNVGADSAITFTIDPNANGGAGGNTTLVVGSATFASGAQVGVVLTDLLAGPETFTVVQAGTLTAGSLDQSLLGNSPFLYVAEARADMTTDEIYIDVRRRTAAEMQLNPSQTAAFNAVYEALGEDDDIRDSFLNVTDRKEFLQLFDQMLPDQGEGLFASLDMTSRGIARLTGVRPDLRQRYGPDSFWIQEINVGVMREAGVTLGSETQAFGFIGGYESMGDDGGALGATLAYMNAEERDDVAQVGEQTNISLVEAGVYWRRASGPFMFSVRGAAGYGFFEGQRKFVDPALGVVRSATAEWGGYTFSANAMASYEARFGRFYLRPTLSVDYFYLNEGERAEDGTSTGFELIVDERTSSRLTAAAELAFGATFGRDNWWRPEVRIGYRQIISGEIGDTIARFTATGTPFTLVAGEPGEGAVVVGLSLRAGTPMSYVAIEGDYEAADGEDLYNLRLAGRVMF